MDAYEPMYAWRRYFVPEFKRDEQSLYIYKHFRLPLINIIDKAQQKGVRIDSERLMDVKFALQERLEGYRKRAIEITGDEDFNLGGSKQMKGELYGYDEDAPVKFVKKKGVKVKTAAQQVAVAMLANDNLPEGVLREWLENYSKEVLCHKKQTK